MIIYTCKCQSCEDRYFDVPEGDANLCPDCGYFGREVDRREVTEDKAETA